MITQKYNKEFLRFFIILFAGFLHSAEQKVYRVPIQGVIDLGLPTFIERVIQEAENDQVEVIIFDIDTFGGRVDAATQIKDAILDSDVPTVAFINRRAISAGALISLSCETIYMTGGGTIGAATAVDMSGNKASEKVISYMREEMASTAESRDRNTVIAKCMVDEELSFTHVIIDGDSVEVTDLEGRKEGKLITLTTEQALMYKMADGTAENMDELLVSLELSEATIISFSENWSENLVRFLTNPVVASLLTTFGFLGILFELQSPGWGIPGTFGAVCLALSLGASAIVRLATMSDLLIVLVGLVLLVVEAFLIPGFGIAGVAGIGVILWGLYLLLLPDVPVSEEVYHSALTGLTIGIIGGVIALVFLFRMVTKTKFWTKLTSPGVESQEEGYSTSIGLE
ncbi:MAG: nodulation protein NfeD, partial [Candidatus Marinimicrobia bacterium]|nr:nodulation protein NfeD [Candidatus Neomarinimicrobiota bacterium]